MTLRPKMYDQPTHPYVCLNWNKATRLKTFLPTSILCLIIQRKIAGRRKKQASLFRAGV